MLLAGCADSPAPDNGVRKDEGTAPEHVSGTWTQLPQAEVGWYRPEGAFWTGNRLLVVAASTVQTWNPRRNKWKVLVDIPQSEECEGCGYSQTVVWTGAELLLWGAGFSYLAPDGSRHRGASVDLDGNVVPLPKAPIRNRWWHDAVWTGSEMIVFGGGRDYHGRRDGASYNPYSRTWRRIPEAPVGGYANTLVWTGTEMITWGGIMDSTTGPHGYPTGFAATGAAYDPARDEWRVLEPSGLDPRGWHSAVWTSTEMLVWGGVAQPNTTCRSGCHAGDAGAYDPESGTWRAIDAGPLSGRVEHTAVWTGSDMIVYGGDVPGGGFPRNDGAAYDLIADTWDLLPSAPTMSRARHSATWTGEEMIVWGGHEPNGAPVLDGASFRPNP